MRVVIDYFRVDSPGFPVDFTFPFLECSDILFAFLEIDIFPKFWHTHFLLISSTGVNGLFSWKACIFIERNNKFKQLEEFTFAHAPYWTKHNQSLTRFLPVKWNKFLRSTPTSFDIPQHACVFMRPRDNMYNEIKRRNTNSSNWKIMGMIISMLYVCHHIKHYEDLPSTVIHQ